MPTVTAVASPGTPLFNTDKKRLGFSVFLPLSQDEIYLCDNPIGDAMYYLQPGEMIIILKVEGYDVERPWYIVLPATSTNGTAILNEFREPEKR
jgi:hypothetical protein